MPATSRNKFLLASRLASLAAMLVLSGCVVSPYDQAGGPPPYYGPEPDEYYWDGYEYIGFIGGEYYYLGPRHAWIVCDPVRRDRFYEWERHHPDWHAHVIHNEHRYDGHPNDGHREEYREPPHDTRAQPAPRQFDRSRDGQWHHDGDRDD